MKRLPLVLLLVAGVAAVVVAVSRGPGPGAPSMRGACPGGECEAGSTPARTAPPASVPATSFTGAPPAARTTPRRSEATPGQGASGPTRADADRLLAEGKVREAVEAFRAVVAAEPTAQNHGDFGRLLYRLAAFDEAAIHLRAAAELDPGNADRWIALANVYYRKVDPGQAWKAEKRAREAEPGLELGRDADGMRVRKSGPTAQRP